MKVILINPPDNLENFLGGGKNLVSVFEPLGLLYISAVCKEYGYNIDVIDASAENLSFQQLKNIIADIEPDVIGITSFVSNGNIVYELGKWIKNEYPNIMVILGNTHASVYAEAYLKDNCCDIVVHGEGEYTFLKILSVLEKKQSDFSAIPSISYRLNEKFFTTSRPTVIENLSRLPLPDRDAVKQELYNMPPITNMLYSGKKNRIAKHMFTSRGCPFSCTFCVVHNNKGQRYNSIINVVNEIEILLKKYSASYIFIMDSIFTSDKNRVITICKEIKRRRLNFKWGCEGHVGFIDQQLAEEMESSGCYDIAFGIESGVQRLLDNVQKKVQLDKIEETVRTIKNNTKIKVSGLFILGLPGETYKDTLQTINFAKKLPLDMAQFSILVPYPGSSIFNELLMKGELDDGRRENGTLDVSVWLRYSPYIFDTHNKPIWVTPALSADTLKKLQKKALREFYFRPKQLYLQLKKIHFLQLPKTIYTSLKTFF